MYDYVLNKEKSNMQDNLINTLISLKEVYKYEKGKPILHDVTLEVKKGQIYTYLGSSGSGKTTTINLILGLIKPSSGSVKLMGVDPYPDCDEAMKARERVGAVLQGNDLCLNLTGMENLLYWAKLYGLNNKKAHDSALNVMRKVKLSKWRNIKVSEYTHGMKMRLSMAKAIINDPDILVLDEPLKDMDTKSKIIIKNLITLLVKRGKAIFLSTTDWGDVQQSYSMLSLVNKGQIIFEGTLKEFIYFNGHKTVFCHMNSARNAEIKANRIKKFCTNVKIKGSVLSFIPGKHYKPNLEDKNIISSWTIKNSLDNDSINALLANIEVENE